MSLKGDICNCELNGKQNVHRRDSIRLGPAKWVENIFLNFKINMSFLHTYDTFFKFWEYIHIMFNSITYKNKCPDNQNSELNVNFVSLYL